MVLERLSGILAHPTSFPSRFGIGDLGQGAYDFIDFAKKCGIKLWQILPLGPTSFGDSPYQSFSTHAGNPLLISPDILKEDGLLQDGDFEGMPQFDDNSVDYGAVIEFKYGLYKKAYERFASDNNQEYETFKEFCQNNKEWLDDYSLFVAIKQHLIEKRRFEFESKEYNEFKLDNADKLNEDAVKDYYYGAAWVSWPNEIKKRHKAAVQKWSKLLAKEIEFEKFLQYEFFKQWQKIKEYANGFDIKIIGDIPIFIAMDSSDVWANPSLFHLDKKGNPTKVAGVPPDYFSVTGQLWGNPIYNWDKHKSTNFKWWVMRIAESLKSVDILRIDHFRGFAACWAVPYGEETAVNGEWLKSPGDQLFATVRAKLGELPIIAEDLGLITEDVDALRNKYSLPGMRILQFGVEGGANDPYIPHNFETTNTVAYTGTHDNDTTLGWYEKADEKYKDYFRRIMNVSGSDPAWDLIRLLFSSVAAYAIVPLQDVMGLGSFARMNTPGTAAGNWRFRYTQEMLSDDLIEKLLYLNKLFNRYKEDSLETEEDI